MKEFKKINLGIGYPYGIISDVHLHNWSAYSTTDKLGTNSRLQQILDAIEQCANEVFVKGGKDLIITGDLFHTRGVIKPSVLNPTIDLFRSISARGMRVYAFDGNHDAEGKVISKYGSSMYALGLIDNFNIFYEPTIVDDKFLFLPWEEEPEKILNLATKGTKLIPKLTLFMHVGMSGVIPGNLGHTLNPSDFDKLDLKYVFSGHFHNHVNFNSRIYSVGALVHQTWGDVGSLAGFLVVSEDEVKHFETKAPKFVDLEIGVNVTGNYVRIKDMELTEIKAQELIKKLCGEDCGAIAALDQSTRPSIKDKDHSKQVKVDLGIDAALETFCKHTYGEKWKEVYESCLKLKS